MAFVYPASRDGTWAMIVLSDALLIPFAISGRSEHCSQVAEGVISGGGRRKRKGKQVKLDPQTLIAFYLGMTGEATAGRLPALTA